MEVRPGKRRLGDEEWTGCNGYRSRPSQSQIGCTLLPGKDIVLLLLIMGGGPGSGIHRSTDGGETWEKTLYRLA